MNEQLNYHENQNCPEERENFAGQVVAVFGGTDVHGNAMAVATEEYLLKKGAKEVKVYCEFPGAQPAKFYDSTIETLEKDRFFKGVDRAIVLDIPLNLMRGDQSRKQSQDMMFILSSIVDDERSKSGKSFQDHNVIYVDHHYNSQFDNQEWMLFGDEPRMTDRLEMEGILVKRVEDAQDCHLGPERSELTKIAAIADKDPLAAPYSTADLETIANGMHIAARESTKELRARIKAHDWDYFRKKAEVIEAIRPPFFGTFGKVVIVESAGLPDTLVNIGLDKILQRADAQYGIGIVRGKKDTKMKESRPPADIVTVVQNWKHVNGKTVREIMTEILNHPFYQAGTSISNYGQEQIWHVRLNSSPITVTNQDTNEELEQKIRSALEGKAQTDNKFFTRTLTALEVDRYITKVRSEMVRTNGNGDHKDTVSVPLYDDLKFATLLLDVARTMGVGVKPDFTQGSVTFTGNDQVHVVEEDTDDRQVFSVIAFLGYLEQLSPLAAELKNDPALGATAVWNKTERNIPEQIYSVEEAIKIVRGTAGISPLLSEAIAVMLRDETRTSYLRTQLLGKPLQETVKMIQSISQMEVGDVGKEIKEVQELIGATPDLRFSSSVDPDILSGKVLKAYKKGRKEQGGVMRIGEQVLTDTDKVTIRDYLLNTDKVLKAAELTHMTKMLGELGISQTETQIIVRTKSTGSAVGKLTKKGAGYCMADMTDIIGGRLILKDVNELLRVSAYIRGKGGILEYLDFYGSPREGDIYRAHHFIRDLDGTTAMELQLKTRLGALWTELYHDAAYKREIYGPALTEMHREAVTDFCNKALLYELREYVKTFETESSIREGYITHALQNLKRTSRTVQGVIDTSASAGKAAAVQAGLSSSETASLAETNFRSTMEYLYDERNRSFTDPSELQEFVEGVVGRINHGITREGVLLRSDDSSKFPYTRIKDLPEAYDKFYAELFTRLRDKSVDPIERAAWIEYRTNFTDHFFADGCGKVSQALCFWTLMREKYLVPQFRSREEHYSYTREKIWGANEKYDKEHYEKWVAYYRSLFNQEEN